MSLSLNNVINISILSAQKGLSNANTSALALITDEEPISSVYGDYGIYLDPLGVGQDFGTNSDTYRLANMIFAQNPNILTGNGYLIVIPRKQSAPAQPATILSSKSVDFTKLSDITNFVIRVIVDGNPSEEIDIGQIDTTNIESILSSLNNNDLTNAGLVFAINGSIASANITLSTIGTGSSKSVEVDIPTTADNGTDLLATLNISGSATGSDSGLERVKDTILRTCQSMFYMGIILNVILDDSDLLETAKMIQTMDKILFVGSNDTADIAGIFTTIKNSGLSHTRCLEYTLSLSSAMDFSAGYASKALSTNFTGSNTVSTMHLKDIIGVVADIGITQTLLMSCQNAGVDFYGDFGVPKTFTSGENEFYDSVYISLALKLYLIVSGFNFLAKTNTKIPQTEEGMNGLKDEYRKIFKQFVDNGSFARGVWTNPTTFGNPEDHIRNIADFGYYIYSQPIAQQLQSQRIKRIAPLVQMCGKSSGAVHFSSAIISIEA